MFANQFRLVPMLVEGCFIHLFHTCVKHCLPPIFRQIKRSKHCSYVTFAAYPLAIGYIAKMAVEIVGLPIQNGDFPYLCKRLPEAYGLYASESHKSFHIYQPLFMDINITINSSEGKTDPFYLAESSVFWVRLGQGIMIRLPASRLGSPFGDICLSGKFGTLSAMDWFKGKKIGKPHISWENLWFPVDFPFN